MQPDEIQYEECNSHSGGGVGRVQGNCQGSKVHNVTIEITTSAGNLAALADYTPGSVVHYTSKLWYLKFTLLLHSCNSAIGVLEYYGHRCVCTCICKDMTFY